MSRDEYKTCQNQRIFGAGIKRQDILFVPATTEETSSSDSSRTAENQYLSIVLQQSPHQNSDSADASNAETRRSKDESEVLDASRCSTCNFPVDVPTCLPSGRHESSLVHQLALDHSYPPSHIDRSNIGFKYLQNHGWDPDSRLGLGATGAGMLAPIKTKVKNNTLGLGVKLPTTLEDTRRSRTRQDTKVVKLNAKQARQAEIKDRKKAQRLRELFYANDDVERYLGDH